MGAPTALAAETASARRRGLPQHRGKTPQPAKRSERVRPYQAGPGTMTLAKIPLVSNGSNQALTRAIGSPMSTAILVCPTRSAFFSGHALAHPDRRRPGCSPTLRTLQPRQRLLFACDVPRMGTVGLIGDNRHAVRADVSAAVLRHTDCGTAHGRPCHRRGGGRHPARHRRRSVRED